METHSEIGGTTIRLQDSPLLKDWLRGGHENPLVHACVYIHAEKAGKVQLNMFAFCGVQLCVNGKPVYTEPKGWQKKEIKDVELMQGWNTLLATLPASGGWCGCSVGIRNEKGDGVPAGLRYTTERPE